MLSEKLFQRIAGLGLVALVAATVSEPASAQAPGRRLDADAIFNWAEQSFPSVFPGVKPTQILDPYSIRFYPETSSYLGSFGDRVLILGPITNGTVTDVGAHSDFACALYPIDCELSQLPGRSWTTGQSLEQGDQTVRAFRAAIDDSGRVVVAFIRSDGSRDRLYALSAAPGGIGSSPVWTTPQAIDTSVSTGLVALSERTVSLSVAANGVAVATWRTSAACTAQTYRKSGTCKFVAAARLDPSTGKWSAPLLLADAPNADNSLLNPVPAIGPAGDFAFGHQGWTASSSSIGYTTDAAVAWWPIASSTPRRQVFSNTTLASMKVLVDGTGRMVVVSEASQESTVDIVAYRGTAVEGFGPQEILDNRTSTAYLEDVSGGQDGQVVAIWKQNDGLSSSTRFAASTAAAGGSWQLDNLGSAWVGSSLAVADDGDALWYRLERCDMRRLSGGRWSTPQPLPRDCAFTNPYFGAVATNRNGDFLTIDNNGAWATYDARRNTMASAFTVESSGPGYLLGLKKALPGTWKLVLNPSGIGAFVAAASFDVLPTPALPAGDGRSSVVNLWGLYFK